VTVWICLGCCERLPPVLRARTYVANAFTCSGFLSVATLYYRLPLQTLFRAVGCCSHGNAALFFFWFGVYARHRRLYSPSPGTLRCERARFYAGVVVLLSLCVCRFFVVAFPSFAGHRHSHCYSLPLPLPLAFVVNGCCTGANLCWFWRATAPLGHTCHAFAWRTCCWRRYQHPYYWRLVLLMGLVYRICVH